MDPDALASLGVRHPSLQPARLPGWRLTFSPEPDIVPAAGQQVEGFFVLVAAETARALLDRRQQQGYVAHPVQVHTEQDAPAAIAFASGRPACAPAPEKVTAYLETCWRLGLPKRHCEGVAAEAQRLQGAREHEQAAG